MQGKAAPTPPNLIVGFQRPDTTPAPRPTYLQDGLAAECWDQVTAVLRAREIYDEDCLHVVFAYCIQWQRFIEATEQAFQAKAMMDSCDNIDEQLKHQQRYSKHILISNTACLMLLRLALHMGLTPTKRHKAHKVSGLNKAAKKYLDAA